jgi:hypothetical protein
MLQENPFAPADDEDDFAEEVTLEFDAVEDPDAVWEWNGEAWIIVAA